MSKIFNFSKNKEISMNNLKNKKLIVNKTRCPQNHPCPSVKVCPVGALTQKGFKAPVVNMDQCIQCGKCVKFCPMRALSLQ
jgi:Fe-S-cluster-containing hydrogenase component 2